MGKIIAFEGTPGAGKTSVIGRMIKEKVLESSTFVSELKIDAGGKDDVTATKLYLEAEVRKSEMVKKLSHDYAYVFLDRSFLTTLAYSYALAKSKNNPQTHKEILEYFEKLDKEHRFVRPDCLIYLTIPMNTSLLRRARFSHLKEFGNWFDTEFLKYFLEFYKHNLNEFGMPSPSFIDTANSNEDIVIRRIVTNMK